MRTRGTCELKTVQARARTGLAAVHLTSALHCSSARSMWKPSDVAKELRAIADSLDRGTVNKVAEFGWSAVAANSAIAALNGDAPIPIVIAITHSWGTHHDATATIAILNAALKCECEAGIVASCNCAMN